MYKLYGFTFKIDMSNMPIIFYENHNLPALKKAIRLFIIKFKNFMYLRLKILLEVCQKVACLDLRKVLMFQKSYSAAVFKLGKLQIKI